MDKKPIYVVMVLFIDKDRPLHKRLIRDRIWGFYHDLETARKCVQENWTDIYENGYYNYALINTMPEGVCVRPQAQEWFFADVADEVVVTTVENPLKDTKTFIGW